MFLLSCMVYTRTVYSIYVYVIWGLSPHSLNFARITYRIYKGSGYRINTGHKTGIAEQYRSFIWTHGGQPQRRGYRAGGCERLCKEILLSTVLNLRQYDMKETTERYGLLYPYHCSKPKTCYFVSCDKLSSTKSRDSQSVFHTSMLHEHWFSQSGSVLCRPVANRMTPQVMLSSLCIGQAFLSHSNRARVIFHNQGWLLRFLFMNGVQM